MSSSPAWSLQNSTNRYERRPNALSLGLGQEDGRIEGRSGSNSPRSITATQIHGASSTLCTPISGKPFLRNGILRYLWSKPSVGCSTVTKINYRWVSQETVRVCPPLSLVHSGSELFNLLINPESHEFALRWHRDDVRETATEDEERQALAIWHHGVSKVTHYFCRVSA